ncbi:MAG: hypothetical protein IJE01_01600 [Clostridia bacterium]|nr:hypothetical protein [Clostridia bacterium]
MTDRDRLIESFSPFADGTYNGSGIIIDGTKVDDVVDYLLANGVIVPPVKFGDTIFVIPSKANYELNILHNREENNRVYEQVIAHITIWKDDYMLYTCDGLCAVRNKAYKDTWFLTKEEAEGELKKRGKENAT